MQGVIDAATALMTVSARRLEGASQNIANVSTSGYKRWLRAPAVDGDFSAELARTRSDMARGKLQQTGNALDLAIAGDGYFKLRDGDRMLYSRQGTFRLMPDGTVATAQGYVLQQAGGSDVVLDREDVKILADGTIVDGAAPVGQVGVFRAVDEAALEPVDGAMFRLPGDDAEVIASPQLRQAMIEASNVSVGDEMVNLMATLRQAESAARLVQTYDELLGRAITSFGQAGR